MYESFGRIERGQVISKADDIADGVILYRVKSLDRDGIEMPDLRPIDDKAYDVSQKVVFFSFPDGTGRILCEM